MASPYSVIREKIATFVEYKMRLGQAQTSLASLSAFIIFACNNLSRINVR